MKKSLLISGLFVTAALVSQSALAEVKIRAGTGSSSYELGGDYIKAKSTYHPTSVGVTFSSDSSANGAGYVDLSFSSGSGHHDGWTTIGDPSESFKRQDFALTGGAVFLNQNNGIAGNVYVGLKTGSTTLDANKARIAAAGYTYPWSEEKFDTAGVVFGGGASFPVAGGRAGSVGVNVGLGIMSATWKDNSGHFDQKSKSAIGGSIGANYTFPFTSNFGVTADYKYQSYSYKFGDASPQFTVDEKFSTLMAFLYVKF
jgi:hypothetical protein